MGGGLVPLYYVSPCFIVGSLLSLRYHVLECALQSFGVMPGSGAYAVRGAPLRVFALACRRSSHPSFLRYALGVFH